MTETQDTHTVKGPPKHRIRLILAVASGDSGGIYLATAAAGVQRVASAASPSAMALAGSPRVWLIEPDGQGRIGTVRDAASTAALPASALLADDQLDEALKVLNTLIAADPTDAQSEIRISEVQRRQGHYDEALATLEKAKSQAPDSLELSYNEALVYDALGKFDQAASVLRGILDASSHPEGAATMVRSRPIAMRTSGRMQPPSLPKPRRRFPRTT